MSDVAETFLSLLLNKPLNVKGVPAKEPRAWKGCVNLLIFPKRPGSRSSASVTVPLLNHCLPWQWQEQLLSAWAFSTKKESGLHPWYTLVMWGKESGLFHWDPRTRSKKVEETREEQAVLLLSMWRGLGFLMQKQFLASFFPNASRLSFPVIWAPWYWMSKEQAFQVDSTGTPRANGVGRMTLPRWERHICLHCYRLAG